MTFLGKYFYTFTNYTEDPQYKLIEADSREEAVAIFRNWLGEVSEDGQVHVPDNLTWHVDDTLTAVKL